MGEDDKEVFSFSNFNPVALLSLILFGVGVVLASVSMGIGQWARFDTDRVDNTVSDGATFKTQSLLSRCVSYELTQAILEQGAGEPESGCLAVSAINCSAATLPLQSSLDNINHNELQNSDFEGNCNTMKVHLQVSSAFVLLGIIASFLAMILFCPLWHFAFFVVGSLLAFGSVIFYSVGLGVFLNLGLDFAGFFSLDGRQADGCLSYGFGIALAAFIINLIATVAGLVAICYKKMCPTRYKYSVKKSD